MQIKTTYMSILDKGEIYDMIFPRNLAMHSGGEDDDEDDYWSDDD